MAQLSLNLHELERTEINRLFDKTEINYIFKQRKQYESGNIRKLAANKIHHLRYVGLEMEIMKLIFFRIHLLKDNTLKLEMQRGIVDRIRSLFKLVTHHFRNDHRPWLWYINFCKKLKLRDCVNQMLEALVCMHGDKPKTWKMAARWEYQEKGSVHTARQFLLRGLRFLPHSTLLFKEAFRLELDYADQLRRKMKENESNCGDSLGFFTPSSQEEKSTDILLDIPQNRRRLIASGGLAEVIYEVASSKLPDVEFIADLLKVARSYNFTAALRLKMIRELCTQFPNTERTWDTVARNELRGLRCFPEHLIDATFPQNDPRNTELYTRTLKERLLRGAAVYSFAVKRLQTKEMWSLYLDTLMKLNSNDYSARRFPVLKDCLLFRGFVAAHKAGHIEEKYYLYWVRFAAAGRRKRLGYVLRIASKKLPRNVGLWQMRLGYCLTKGDEQEALSALKEALVNMKNETGSLLCLWTSVLEHGLSDANPIIEKMFLEGMKPNSPLSGHLKPMYLDWLSSTKNIQASREAYEKMRFDEPMFVHFHYSMAELELAQHCVDLDRARQCFENACEKFGRSSPDPWVQYAKMELMRGDLESTYEIQRRALEALNPVDSDEFICKYSYLRSSIYHGQNNLISENALNSSR